MLYHTTAHFLVALLRKRRKLKRDRRSFMYDLNEDANNFRNNRKSTAGDTTDSIYEEPIDILPKRYGHSRFVNWPPHGDPPAPVPPQPPPPLPPPLPPRTYEWSRTREPSVDRNTIDVTKYNRNGADAGNETRRVNNHYY